MSGHSYSEKCPNCGQAMNSYSDSKPVSTVSHECAHCGLMISPNLYYMNLNELNSTREDWEMEKLEELPKQDLNAF